MDARGRPRQDAEYDLPGIPRKACAMKSSALRSVASVTLAGLVLVMAGCSVPAASDASASPTPDDHITLDEAALSETVRSMAESFGAPGAVAFIRTPDAVFVEEYGVTEFEGSTPVSVDQHLRVGSNTKTWTGTVVLQLAQEGKISLDDPVSKYRPDVPGGDDITIEQLLNMRSGLGNFTAALEHNEAMDADPQRVWQPDELLAIGYAQPRAETDYLYSNTNTVLAALIAEQLEGKPIAQIFQERLFTPLGMDDTVFPDVESNAIPEPFTHGYMYGTNVSTMNGALTEEEQALIATGGETPVDHTFDNPSWGWAAGAGISTVPDLVTWVEALSGGELLDEEYQSLRMGSLQPTNPDMPEAAKYGLAIAQFGPFYGHSGELPGYNSFMGHDPEKDVTVVVWVNLAPLPDGRGPANAIAQALIGQIYAS